VHRVRNARGVIEDVHGVDAHVSLGVPLRVLRHAEEVFDSGKCVIQPVALRYSPTAAGMCAFDGPLHEFFRYTLAR